MALPAFTAQSSLYRTARSYRARGGGPTGAVLVTPQDTCGACTCTDPRPCCKLSSGSCSCDPCQQVPAAAASPDMIRR
jgi:hypothetical protein